jgi:hypothetical protein
MERGQDNHNNNTLLAIHIYLTMPFPQSPSFGGSGSGSPLNLNPSVGSDGPRQYSAGYISTTSSTGHYHMDHSQSMNAISQKNALPDQDDWVSSPINSNRMRTGTGAGSTSKSPYRGSGGGLFAFKESVPHLELIHRPSPRVLLLI